MCLQRKTSWLGLLCSALVLTACAWPARVTVTPVPPPTPSPAAPKDSLAQPDAMLPAYAGDVERQATATRYTIHLKIDPSYTRVSGRQQVLYTNAETVPLQEIYFRLFPATPGYGGEMTVAQVRVNDRLAATALEQDGSALKVLLDAPLQPGRSLTLSLDFAVSVPRDGSAGYAQLTFTDGVLTLPNIYPIIPVYDEAGWRIELSPGYGDAVYSDTALYDVDIETPAGALVTTGVCRLLQAGAAQQQQHCVSGPTRDFMLALSDAYAAVSQEVDGIRVSSFYLPQHAEAGQQALEHAARALQIYGRRFGAYPFAEFDIIETPTTAGGIEYPGMVVIAENLYDEPEEFFEWVIAHEVAHQWWYSLVGNDQVNHPWLDEALAQYSTLLYYEDAHDAATASFLLNSQFEQPHQTLVQAGEDAPVDQPVGAFTPGAYGAIVYRKGPLFFHALRQAMGDHKFNAFLQTYYRQNLYGIATPASLLAAAQTALPKSTVLQLYDEWIRGTRQP